MHEQRLTRRVHLRGLGKRGMQRKGAVQFGRRRRIDCERTAQALIGRFGIRHHDVQTIGRAALDHENEAAVGLDAREGHVRRHENRACTGCGEAKKLATGNHGVHLR
jgi:hypothetical protein